MRRRIERTRRTDERTDFIINSCPLRGDTSNVSLFMRVISALKLKPVALALRTTYGHSLPLPPPARARAPVAGGKPSIRTDSKFAPLQMLRPARRMYARAAIFRAFLDKNQAARLVGA